MPRDVAALLVRDCEQLALVEEALGARGPGASPRISSATPERRKRFMGAGDTYIAKPWRREVYLQVAAYPHPVLAHELAHVVAGSFEVGPFRVAGRYGGLLDQGMIEGVAVAAAPEHDVLSELEWSRAMDSGSSPSSPRSFRSASWGRRRPELHRRRRGRAVPDGHGRQGQGRCNLQGHAARDRRRSVVGRDRRGVSGPPAHAAVFAGHARVRQGAVRPAGGLRPALSH
ncbi:MAG: hypothetical protein U0235_17530 [Polyangiaceae bacterium]